MANSIARSVGEDLVYAFPWVSAEGLLGGREDAANELDFA